MENNIRLRRLRSHEIMRNMIARPFPEPSRIIYPLFVGNHIIEKEEIHGLKGQYRWNPENIVEKVRQVYKQGIKSFLLFGVVDSSLKTPLAEESFSSSSAVVRTLEILKKEFKDILLWTDICVCAYTNHGHCGIFEKDRVDNDLTLKLLGKMALAHAKAGAFGVAPSACMDFQVKYIRKILDENEYSMVSLMSYSTKFSSSMYGPFRHAASSHPAFGGRTEYQTDFRNLNLALQESLLDIEEGADILMVKPSLWYLDVISKLKEKTRCPIAAYNVSGEYAMIHTMAHEGLGNLYEMIQESFYALDRAGADIIISYFADIYEQFAIR